jgi:hypothetical protein
LILFIENTGIEKEVKLRGRNTQLREDNMQVNPVRNSSGALNPGGIILKSNPAAAAGPEGLWPGGSSGALFLTG